VNWKTETGVAVECNTGEFTADFLVVTLPLGVLKKKAVEFNPPLPEWKTSAIAGMGMSVAHKVVLRYPEVFWPRLEFFGFANPTAGEFIEWCNLAEPTDAPILSLWSHGDAARRLESAGADAATKKAVAAVRRVFGENTPAPTGSLVTSWGTDPFSLGAYSHWPVGGSPEWFDQLAAAVEGTLFFAGEATNRAHAATVHGAYLSGQRAAGELLAAIDSDDD
jgi:monoamine oxidase